VGEQPDEREVQIPEEFQLEGDPNDVDDHRTGHHHRRNGQTEPLVEIQHARGQRNDEQIDR
jgi:hypothetical protein